uniref:Uncharacterized protein n=1 Tax=Arundo donax TaxID=35708 RepID=A0A0A8Y6T1_ARUDO
MKLQNRFVSSTSTLTKKCKHTLNLHTRQLHMFLLCLSSQITRMIEGCHRQNAIETPDSALATAGLVFLDLLIEAVSY